MTKQFQKEKVFDAIKAVLKAFIFFVCALGYWFGLLMVLSLFLLNIWHVELIEILIIAFILTLLTIVTYLIIKSVRRNKNSHK